MEHLDLKTTKPSLSQEVTRPPPLQQAVPLLFPTALTVWRGAVIQVHSPLFHLEKLLRIILLYGFSFHNSDIKHKWFLVISLLVSHPDSIPPSGDLPNHGPPYNNYGYPGMQPAYQQGPAPYVDSSPSHDLYGKQQPQQYAQVSQQSTRVLAQCLEEAWDNTTLHHSNRCWMADWCSLLFVIYIWHILHFLVYNGDKPI